MDQEKWGEILDRVKSQFEIIEHTKATPEGGVGETETLIFTNPMGKIKLEWITRPVIIDKKVIGAHRRGGAGQAQVEYVYSDTETTHKLEAHREVDGEWQAIDNSIFN